MANFTKAAIKASFRKLLEQRPLSKITVKDIVADCGVNRNTFYYYFSDIPKLIEEIVMEDNEAIISAYPTVENLEDCIGAVIDSALAKKQSVLHIYHSTNREIYEQYLWTVFDHVVDAYFSTVLQGRRLNETDLTILKKCLSSVAFGIASNWLRSGMGEDIRGTFARLCELQKGLIAEMLARCEDA